VSVGIVVGGMGEQGKKERRLGEERGIEIGKKREGGGKGGGGSIPRKERHQGVT